MKFLILPGRAVRLLEAMAAGISTLKKGMTMLQDEIDELRKAVEANTSATQSAATMLDTLADKLEAAADDPEEIRQLAASVRSNSQALADAVTRNTPSEEPPAGGTGDTTGGEPQP